MESRRISEAAYRVRPPNPDKNPLFNARKNGAASREGCVLLDWAGASLRSARGRFRKGIDTHLSDRRPSEFAVLGGKMLATNDCNGATSEGKGRRPKVRCWALSGSLIPRSRPSELRRQQTFWFES